MPVPILPDSIALVREALLDQPSLTTLVADRVYDRIPAAPVWPLLVLTVADEIETEWHTGRARVQVDAWGGGADATAAEGALEIARTLRSVARDMRGSWMAGDISNVSPEIIISAPDPETGRARYILDLIIETNP